ncbi:MAG: tetratricopeptide repeat protein [Acidobacteriota bacterium]
MVPVGRLPALVCVAACAWSAVAQDQAANSAWEQAFRAAAELHRQGNYAEAAAIMSAVVKTAERAGPGDARLASALNNMGAFYQDLGRYAESEKHYGRALRILDKDPGADPALLLATVNNLATLYYDTGRYAASERLLRRYRPIRENLGLDSPESLAFLKNLAATYEVRRRYTEAEAVYKEALAVVLKKQNRDRALGPLLTSLGVLCANTKRYGEALGHLEGSLAICHRLFGEDHPETIRPLLSLSTVYARTGRLAEAERYVKQALAIARHRLGAEHPITGLVLSNYAVVLRQSGRKAEGKEMKEQARAIKAKTARDNPTHHSIDLSELLSVPGRR